MNVDTQLFVALVCGVAALITTFFLGLALALAMFRMGDTVEEYDKRLEALEQASGKTNGDEPE